MVKKDSFISNIFQTVQFDEKNILHAINKGKINGEYPAALQSFALTLHVYSPRAYEYVKQQYINKLPAPSTIRSWYSYSNGSPGFTEDALDAIKL